MTEQALENVRSNGGAGAYKDTHPWYLAQELLARARDEALAILFVSEERPTLWEKKGASLNTVTNVTRYPELWRFTTPLFNKIERLGGFVFYVGVGKSAAPGDRGTAHLQGGRPGPFNLPVQGRIQTQ